MTHTIKVLPMYYEPIVSNIKHFELRKDDRDYQVGDFVILREWINGVYTGREMGIRIKYVIRDRVEYGLMKGHCIFGW